MLDDSRPHTFPPRKRAIVGRLALGAAASAFGLSALHAGAPRLLGSAVASAAVIAPVAPLISADPDAARVRGTMILVHGGGWAGHSAAGQARLMDIPGQLLLRRGWRVVSIDYQEGAAGLQNVLDAAGAELVRKTGDGPLCIYGQSAGAHLALVAASRLRAIDCVVGLGTPTDLGVYESEGSVSSDFRVRLVAHQIRRFFGTTSAELAPWDLVSLAPAIRADVLLVHEGDDTIVPLTYTTRFQAARHTTQTLTLQAGDHTDPATAFVHGTISQAGRKTTSRRSALSLIAPLSPMRPGGVPPAPVATVSRAPLRSLIMGGSDERCAVSPGTITASIGQMPHDSRRSCDTPAAGSPPRESGSCCDPRLADVARWRRSPADARR